MKTRRAVLEYAQSIAKVHVDSWRTTYTGIIPDAFLQQLSVEKRIALWEQNIEVGFAVFVVENKAGEVIGFACTNTRETNDEPQATDLTSIYLLQDYQGMGIGKLLMQELFTYYKQQGFTKVFVEVLAENPTRHFYVHYGAELVDTVTIHIGGKAIKELIYVWNSVDEVVVKLND